MASNGAVVSVETILHVLKRREIRNTADQGARHPSVTEGQAIHRPSRGCAVDTEPLTRVGSTLPVTVQTTGAFVASGLTKQRDGLGTTTSEHLCATRTRTYQPVAGIEPPRPTRGNVKFNQRGSFEEVASTGRAGGVGDAVACPGGTGCREHIGYRRR